MKHFLKFLAAAVLGFILIGCSREDDHAVADFVNNGTVTSSTSTIVLTKANAAQNAVTFSFTNPDYGTPIAYTNVLEFAVKGTNFAAPKSVAIPAGTTSVSYTVQEFNALMLSLGLPVNSVSQIEARLKSTVTSTVDPVYSTPITISVTPYALISYMYMPGDYQGWNPATANVLTSATSNGVYEGYITFDPSKSLDFKITQDKNWDVAYGSDDASKLSTTGGNIKAPGYGSYKITVDMNAKTIVFKPYSWGIVGSAAPNGWNGPDAILAWNDTTKKWEANVALTSGEAKIRLNNDWGTNYGGAGLSGTAENGGSNIAISTAGNYKIVFDEAGLTYSFTKL